MRFKFHLVAAIATLTLGVAWPVSSSATSVDGALGDLSEDAFRNELVNAPVLSPIIRAIGLDRLGAHGALAVSLAAEEVVAECMRAKGWRYEAGLLRDDVGVEWLPSMSRQEFASTHGFGGQLDPIATSGGRLSERYGENMYINSMSLEEERAYGVDLYGPLADEPIGPLDYGEKLVSPDVVKWVEENWDETQHRWIEPSDEHRSEPDLSELDVVLAPDDESVPYLTEDVVVWSLDDTDEPSDVELVEPAGCSAAPLEEMWGGDFGELSDLMWHAHQQVASDPAFIAASQTYAACMTSRGFPQLNDPWWAMHKGYALGAYGGFTPAEEIAAALAELDCRYPTEVVVRRLVHEVEAPLVTQNADLLARVKTHIGG